MRRWQNSKKSRGHFQSSLSLLRQGRAMANTSSRPALARRAALNLLATAGVAAGGYALFEYTPWLNDGLQASEARQPLDIESNGLARMKELVRYATLAANGHNTQPWQFAISQNAIDIHPVYARRVPVVDPHDRELWLSLGCALENLVIAARGVGYAPEVTYPDSVDIIQVRLTPDTRLAGPLVDAVLLRQNTRSEYDGQPIQSVDLDQVQALPLEPGISLRVVTHPTDLETMLEYVNQGNLSQYADRSFVDDRTYAVERE